MTKSELERLPKEFLVDIALAAVRYTNTRGQSGAPAHYRKLRDTAGTHEIISPSKSPLSKQLRPI